MEEAELEEATELVVVELELVSRLWSWFAVVQPLEPLYCRSKDNWATDEEAVGNQEAAGVVNGRPFRQSHPSSWLSME